MLLHVLHVYGLAQAGGHSAHKERHLQLKVHEAAGTEFWWLCVDRSGLAVWSSDWGSNKKINYSSISKNDNSIIFINCDVNTRNTHTHHLLTNLCEKI